MSLGARLACGLLTATCGLAACAVSGAPPPAPAPVAPTSAGLDRDFQLVEAVGQGVLLPLPDPGGWRRDPRETKTWVVSHGASDSRLLVRTFRADGAARRVDCERQLRLWRPELPALGPGQRAETRRLELDGGYAAELVTGAVRAPATRGVTGHALLFAGAGRDCLCIVFSTSAQGDDAASIVGARLGSITRGALERARRIGIEAAVSAPGRRAPGP